MNISILADAPASDHSARQFLPASAAVKGPRFQRRQWETSQQVREILDDIYHEVSRASAEAPAPRALASSESIVMEGPRIRATYRCESGVVATRDFTTSLGHEDALSIVEAPAIETAPTVRDAAAAALMEINRRKVAPARRTAPTPAAGRPWMLKAVAYALASGGLVFAGLALAKAVL
ncbi:MAG: hypothetical protein ACLPTF_04850 [Steroidobacteraceae bacterium]